VKPIPQDTGDYSNPSGFNSWNCVDLVIDGVNELAPSPLPPRVLEFLREQRAKLARYREMMKQATEGGQPPSVAGPDVSN
jgi:hypothetical protein